MFTEDFSVNQAKSLQSAVSSIPSSNSLLKPRLTTVESSNQKNLGGPPVVPLNPLFQSPKSPRENQQEKLVAGSASILTSNDDNVSLFS